MPSAPAVKGASTNYTMTNREHCAQLYSAEQDSEHQAEGSMVLLTCPSQLPGRLGQGDQSLFYMAALRNNLKREMGGGYVES